ncbi:hypothetical protein [Geminisphaera colitermitum]|uniref:hypothetical protein n=1 Tax=Geminisphaera colitermitum TaxID=1148786 RepID=UPI0012FE8938|nr:hypothetical protein [Geminisphaera colitermitum]
MPRPAYAGFASEAPTRGAGVSPASEQNAGGTPAPLCHQHDAGRMPALPGAIAPDPTFSACPSPPPPPR